MTSDPQQVVLDLSYLGDGSFWIDFYVDDSYFGDDTFDVYQQVGVENVTASPSDFYRL